MTRVYKILTRTEWKNAQAAGAFPGSALDLADGYIHLSTAAQADETARRHFHGQADLVIAGFDVEPFGDKIRWEASRGGQMFPHLYAPLPTAGALTLDELPLDGGGAPVLPPLPA